jgi:hypothetical protein
LNATPSGTTEPQLPQNGRAIAALEANATIASLPATKTERLRRRGHVSRVRRAVAFRQREQWQWDIDK